MVRQVSSAAVARAIATRSLKLIPRLPATFIPSLVMPIFLTIAFAGAFEGIVGLPGFPTDKILNWFIPMTICQGAAFAGITTGLGVARDLETGFYDRLLSAPASRGALLAGPLAASVARATLPMALLSVIALLGDSSLPGGILGLLALAGAALGIGFVAGAYAVGLALTFRSQQAAPLMQVGVLVSFFLSTAQMPLDLLSGWMKVVATYNPMTRVLHLARSGFLGEVSFQDVWPGAAAIAGLSVLTLTLAIRKMARISER